MTELGTGPLDWVSGPPPIPRPYGLLQTANSPAAGVRIVPDATDGVERWGNGVEVWPYPPDITDAFHTCAPGSERYTKGFGEEVTNPIFDAFTLWLAATCSASRIPSQEEFKARATSVFTVVESAGAAHELMTGSRLPANPHLSDGEGVFPNGDTATSVMNGLALLEDEIAESGRLGLIHMSPAVALALSQWFVIDKTTGVLRTISGNVIIPDAGYADGAAPHGHPAAGATQAWIYATGPIDVRRSEVVVRPDEVSQALDRGMGATNDRPNSITYRVERDYVVDWDTQVQAAVLVDRCQTTC